MQPCKCGATLPDRDGYSYQIGNGPAMCRPCLDRINATELRQRRKEAERYWAKVEAEWRKGLDAT